MAALQARSKVLLHAAALICVASLAIPAPALATKTLGLSSGTFKFSVAAGDVVGGQVFVVNDGTEPLKVLVYAADQRVDDKGTIAYTAPSRADLASQQNPSTWTRVSMPADSKSLGNIPYLELKPGQRFPVKFSFTVPTSVTPGDHNVVVFFESFEMPKAGEGAQSMVSGRLGARVTLRVKGEIVERLDVRPFEVPAFVIGSEIPYRYVVRNLGNVDQRVIGRALLLDRSENEVTSQIPIEARLVFAGEQLEASGTLVAERQPWGPHSVSIDVTPVDDTNRPIDSGKNAITKTRTVWLIPLWLVVAVIAIAVLVVGRLIWTAALRAANRSHEKASKGGALTRPTPDDDDDDNPTGPSRTSRESEAQARREARAHRQLEAEAEARELEDVRRAQAEAQALESERSAGADGE